MTEYSPVALSVNTSLSGASAAPSLKSSASSDKKPARISIQDGPIHRFISIYGTPPPPSEQRETVSRSIVPSPDPSELIDCLDANDEDPFTLETFQSMIDLHAEKDREFIIARVTTVDPDDDTRFYYSYYAAHHINKVLFRTQPEEGLLHRMRAKNPLNNMTIVGDVHYYTIKPTKVLAPKKSTVVAAPKSPLETIVNLVYPQHSDSPTTKRAREIREHFKEKLHPEAEHEKGGIFAQLLGFQSSRMEPLQFMIRQEAYENDIEMEDRAIIAGKRNSFDDAYSDLAPNLRPTSSSKIMVLNRSQPSRHRNVRSVAFANERTTSMTIEDWIRLKNDPSPDAIVMSASTRIVIDESPTRKRTARSPVRHETNSKAGNEPVNKFYTAQYYASDDDFLMHPSVRSFFKANALEDQDHVLFTISSSNSRNAEGEAHPTLTNLSLFLGDEESRASSEFKKRLKWIILVYGVGSFFVVKFVVPPTYQYVAAFFLFFLFCIGLIISL
ncbi:hypothetical protein HDV03_002716 [Kappamyces sp. JEL0829]|nr:hypothetical protein HDV03_002716 [Kappamyces sp. JEL0829]